MKIEIKIFDEVGNVYEGSMFLSVAQEQGSPNKISKGGTTRKSMGRIASVDFDLNERAFAKRYAKSLSGPKKFTLLVAYLTKGDFATQITSNEVEKLWNKMKGLLGGKFSRSHSNRAKEYGWVDAPKRGCFRLRKEWSEVLVT